MLLGERLLNVVGKDDNNDNHDVANARSATITIGHSIGKADCINSNFVGSGWDLIPNLMLTGYSTKLVGGSLANDTVSNLMKGAPDNNSFGLKVIFFKIGRAHV